MGKMGMDGLISEQGIKKHPKIFNEKEIIEKIRTQVWEKNTFVSRGVRHLTGQLD